MLEREIADHWRRWEGGAGKDELASVSDSRLTKYTPVPLESRQVLGNCICSNRCYIVKRFLLASIHLLQNQEHATYHYDFIIDPSALRRLTP